MSGMPPDSFEPTPTVLWTLWRGGQRTSCEVAFVPSGIEIRIFLNKSLLTSRTFSAAHRNVAIAWAEEQYQDYVEREWFAGDDATERPASDLLIVRIEDEHAGSRECCLCGQWFPSQPVQSVAYAHFDDTAGEMKLGVVCDLCVGGGVKALRKRIALNAQVTRTEDEDEDFAETLTRLSKGDIDLPPIERLLAVRQAPPPPKRRQ